MRANTENWKLCLRTETLKPPLPGKPPLRYGLLGNSLKITRIIQSGAILSFFFFQPEMYEEQW